MLLFPRFSIIKKMFLRPSILVLVVLIHSSSAFYFFVDQKPVCVGISRPHQALNIVYEVSSADPQNFKVEIFDQHQIKIRQFVGRTNSTTVQSDQPFHVCFSTLDNTEKVVSWDMWLDSTSQMKKLASKSDMSIASNILRTVTQQQKFQEEREHIHVGIISETQDSVKLYGVAKILIILLVVGLQLVVLKLSLKRRDYLNFM